MDRAALLLLLGSSCWGPAPAAAQDDPWHGACPAGCECFANTRGGAKNGCAVEVRCEELSGSQRFPTGYAEETECIGLSIGALSKLSATEKSAMFAAMPAGIKLLDLSMCGLGVGVGGVGGLPPATFGRFTQLRFLNLEFNGLTSLPADAFHGLASLRTLWLTGNHYQRGEPGYAEKEQLGNNIAGALAAEQFAGLASLQCLLMHHNKLSGLPDALFGGTPMLRVLKLVDNAFAPPGLREVDAVFAPLLARAGLPLCEGGRPSTGACLQLDTDRDSGDALEDIWDGLGIGLADDKTVLAAPKDMPAEYLGGEGGGGGDGGDEGEGADGDEEGDEGDEERRDEDEQDEL